MPASSGDFPQLEDDYDSQGVYTSSAPAFGVREALAALRRYWLFPVVGCLIGFMPGLFYIATKPPTYTSSARILVDRSTNRYLQTNKIVDEPVFDQAELASQVHILSSESIVLPVIRSLDLTHDTEFVGRPDSEAHWTLSKIRNLVGVVRKAFGGTDAARLDDALLERIAVEAFFKRLTVYREDVANVINVTFASEDPNKAARIANAVADKYIARSQEAKSQSTKIASELLQDRLAELKAQAADAERVLQNYKANHNLEGIDKDRPDQIAILSAELTKARITAAEAKDRLDRIRRAAYAGAERATATDNSNAGIITKLRVEYMNLAEKTDEMSSRVAPEHEALVKLKRRLAGLRTSIRTEEERIAASEYQNAKVRERELAATVERVVAEGNTKNQAQIKMRELESSTETLRTLYNSILQKYQEINASQPQGTGVRDVTIVTRAAAPLYKASKKGLLVLGGGFVLGLLLGAAAAVGKEWIADVFRRPDVVTQATGIYTVILPVAARNPKRPGYSRDGTMPTMIEEFVLDNPFSRFSEALRSVKSLINVAQAKNGAKVIGVVSSVANEGKTTIAANLGALIVTESRAGTRVLIVDGDLHKRRLSALLAPDAGGGLIEALAEPSQLAALVCKRPRSGLDVLPCVLQTRLPNAADLLGSPKMEQLLAEARKAYDIVIIEVPPIMSVVDLKAVERYIDCFIFVVEWGHTKRKLVMEALSEAQMIRERLLSIVLNKVDPLELRTIEAYKGAKFEDYYEG